MRWMVETYTKVWVACGAVRWLPGRTFGSYGLSSSKSSRRNRWLNTSYS